MPPTFYCNVAVQIVVSTELIGLCRLIEPLRRAATSVVSAPPGADGRRTGRFRLTNFIPRLTRLFSTRFPLASEYFGPILLRLRLARSPETVIGAHMCLRARSLARPGTYRANSNLIVEKSMVPRDLILQPLSTSNGVHLRSPRQLDRALPALRLVQLEFKPLSDTVMQDERTFQRPYLRQVTSRTGALLS
jgi:hypothetical protein